MKEKGKKLQDFGKSVGRSVQEQIIIQVFLSFYSLSKTVLFLTFFFFLIGEVSALVGLGDLAVFKNKIPKATKLYTQALNVAMSRSRYKFDFSPFPFFLSFFYSFYLLLFFHSFRKQLEDGAHLKIPPLLSLLHLYFIQPTLPPLSPLLAVKSESDLPESMIVGSESMIEKLSQLLLEDLSLYTTSSLPIDFHLAQHFQKLNKMRGLLERLLSEMDEGDEKRIWAEKLLKKISCVLLMMK